MISNNMIVWYKNCCNICKKQKIINNQDYFIVICKITKMQSCIYLNVIVGKKQIKS